MMRMRFFRRIALARHTSCLWPTLKFEPDSASTVSSLLGRSSTTAFNCTCREGEKSPYPSLLLHKGFLWWRLLRAIQTHPLTAWHNAEPGPKMTLASALLWPASSFNPGHQTHSEAGPGAEALHCGGSLHPGRPDCPNTSPPALSMAPSYKPHIELGPMALMGFPPMTCGEQGGWMAALYRGTEGSPPGLVRGNHSEPRWSTSWSAFHRSSSVCCLKGSRFFLTVPVKRTGSCG